MLTFLATFTVGETGDVTSETYVNQGTYEHKRAVNTYGSPYLANFDTSEDWREALGRYAKESIENMFSVGGCHGHALAYVDSACSIYVIELDFDYPKPV